MLYFFSFCCLIGKQTKDELLFATNLLIKSMDKFIKQYKFIIYTNFNLDLHIQNSNIEIRKYYNHKENELLFGNNQWKNLSMNKLFIYKDLYDEFKIDYTWIDLDTYIYYDLSYIENLDNYFLEYGGEFKRLEKVSSNFKIEFHKYIQGNFWKLNINLYIKLIELLNTLKQNSIQLEYDSQSLFTYYFYKILNGNLQNMNINILGNNSYQNSLNGIAIWCEKNNGSHASLNGLNNLFLDKNILRSKFHENKEIHIVSFTFLTLMKIKNNIVFNKLFN
jgi:hypothetical protein